MVYLSHDLKHSGYDYLNKNQLKIDNIPETLAPVGGFKSSAFPNNNQFAQQYLLLSCFVLQK